MISDATRKKITFGLRAVIALGVLGLGFVLFFTPSTSVSDSHPNDKLRIQLSLFHTVFRQIQQDYVEEVSDDEIFANALRGMLTGLDPHSDYLNSTEYTDTKQRTEGAFGGLGIQITMEEGFVKVISPIDETPAARAGIESGDLIIRIGDENVIDLTLAEAVERIKGPIGTDVTITISRQGIEPFDLTLTRDTIKVRAVRYDSYGTIGYIRITTFSEQTTAGLLEAITELNDEHGEALRGIVLDLRNNPGGLLSEAVSVADVFLDRGDDIVSIRGRNDADIEQHSAKSSDALAGLPVVVLINAGSASAAEIVAGALQDHRRALIMGVRSFGKGSVQSLIPLDDYGAMRLTTARYYTPSGVSIQATGITPDIEVEPAEVEPIEGGVIREEDLSTAIDRSTTPTPANGDEASDTTADEQAASESVNLADYQLARALDLLYGISVFETVIEQ